jgi:RimJ/RimL family protein N-acetyltransferase
MNSQDRLPTHRAGKRVAIRKPRLANGFRLEGVMRQAVVRQGSRHNFLTFGLLKTD